jgi:hypothetical protein
MTRDSYSRRCCARRFFSRRTTLRLKTTIAGVVNYSNTSGFRSRFTLLTMVRPKCRMDVPGRPWTWRYPLGKSAPGKHHRIEQSQVLQAFFDVGPHRYPISYPTNSSRPHGPPCWVPKRKERLNPATGTLELPQLAQEIEHNPCVHFIEVPRC